MQWKSRARKSKDGCRCVVWAIRHVTTAGTLPGLAVHISGLLRVNALNISIWMLYPWDVNVGDKAQ